MAVTSHVYPNAQYLLGTKAINLTSDTFKVGLLVNSTATWGSTQQAYQYISAVTGAYTEVATGGGYTSGYSGRVGLTTLTFSNNSPAGKNVWTCTSPAPISFGATTTISAAAMFVADYSIGSSDTNTPVIAIIDFGGTVASSSGAWTYTVDSVNGLAVWTES